MLRWAVKLLSHFVLTHSFLINPYVVILKIQVKEPSFALDRYLSWLESTGLHRQHSKDQSGKPRKVGLVMESCLSKHFFFFPFRKVLMLNKQIKKKNTCHVYESKTLSMELGVCFFFVFRTLYPTSILLFKLFSGCSVILARKAEFVLVLSWKCQQREKHSLETCSLVM